MTHARSQHPNARLTPRHRRNMVGCVMERGWTVEATAERFQVDAKTVRKWRDRFVAEGDAGLQDRSSRPHRSPNRTSRASRREVVRLRTMRRWGADHIGHELGLAASTVQSILRAEGLGRLDTGDRAADREPPRRYQRDRPGELVHVDVKKLGRIQGGAGKRWGRRHYTPLATDAAGVRRQTVGWEFCHVCVDDATRLAYVEVLDDEQGTTAAGFLRRAVAWFASMGIAVERVLSDNGSCYRSASHARACSELGLRHLRTRPYRPQTNGKAERFIQTALREWAYAQAYSDSEQRTAELPIWMHRYNWHRPHGSLKSKPPISRLALSEDNLLRLHS